MRRTSSNGDRSVRAPLPLVLCAALCAASASAQPVAERVRVANAPTHLFGGTDADGGIDDWYLSNGVVLPVGTYSLEFRSVERDPITAAGSAR